MRGEKKQLFYLRFSYTCMVKQASGRFVKRIIILISIMDWMLWRAMFALTLHKQCIYEENIRQITVCV